MEIKMNATREAVLATLRANGKAMTLAEIAKAMGVEKVASGSTNAMVKAGLIHKAGKVKVAKVVYVEVETYELGAGEIVADTESDKAEDVESVKAE